MCAFPLILSLFILWFPSFVPAQGQTDAPSGEVVFPIGLPFDCHGDVEYVGEDNALVIRSTDGDRANVVYGERSITADQIIVDLAIQQIRAHGNVRMWDNGRLMVADQAVYDLEKEEARFYNLKHANLDPRLYLTGDRVVYQAVPGGIPEGATEPETMDQYTVMDGTVTTCDLPIPHYYIKYDSMTIIPGDRFWLHDVWYLQGGFPLGYLPFFTRSLAEHKIAYIFYGGHMSDLGVATLHKVNVHLDPRLRFAFMGDTFSQVGYGYGASWHFHFPGQYGPDGTVKWYGVSQRDPDDDWYFDDEDRYRFSGDYKQELPHGIKITSEFQRSSDFEFNEDYDRVMRLRGASDYELERDVPSSLSVSKSWDRQTVRVTGAKYFEDFFYSQLPRTERLPQARWDLMPSTMGSTGLYMDAHLAYDDARREQGYHRPLSRTEQTNYIDEIQRTDGELRFFYPLGLPYGWYLSPYAGYRGTDYSDPTRRVDGVPERSFDDQFRSMLETGTELGTRSILYWNPPEFGELRWLFEPVFGYDYFDPSEELEEIGLADGSRFPYVDDVDDFRATFHRVSARLNTKLQHRGNQGVRTLGRLTMGAAYDHFPDDNLRFDNLVYTDDRVDPGDEDHRYTDFFEEFRVHPLHWVALGNYLRYDVDDSTLRTSNSYLDMYPAQYPWSVRLGLSTFEDALIDREQQEDVYYRTRWKLSKKWSVLFGQRYDLDDNTLRKSNLIFVRNLHDFQALIELEQRNRRFRDDEYSVIFSLRFLGLGGRYGVF